MGFQALAKTLRGADNADVLRRLGHAVRSVASAPVRLLRYFNEPVKRARATFDAKPPAEKARVERRERGSASFLPAFIPPTDEPPNRPPTDAP